jgi:hypothetical protein
MSALGSRDRNCLLAANTVNVAAQEGEPSDSEKLRSEFVQNVLLDAFSKSMSDSVQEGG